MNASLRAVVGGHRFDRDAFTDLLEAAAPGIWRVVEREAVDDDPVAVEVRYDISGLDLARGSEPVARPPSDADLTHLRGLSDTGTGLVVLHHAIASWPTWDGWADAVGGRFLYAPGTLRGRRWPASGYAMADFTVSPVTPTHPVGRGIEPFALSDERYLCPVFDDEVVPLLLAEAPLAPKDAVDTHAEVVSGVRRPATDHPAGSALLGWVTSVGSSPVVVLLPGHGPGTLRHPSFVRLVANAVEWVAGAEARRWAADRDRPGW